MKILCALLILAPFSTLAAVTDACAVPGSSVEIDMTRSMAADLKLNEQSIAPPHMELLAVAPVSKELAGQYAKESRDIELKRGNSVTLSYEGYFSAFHDNGAKTLLIKYTYENNEKKKNIFVASSLVNDEECSIRFNGYVTLQREY